MIKKLLHKSSNSAVIAVVLVCSLMLSACGKNQTPAPAQPPKAAVAQLKPVQKQVSSALRISPPPVNQLDFSNKKDPFKPFVTAKVEVKTSPGSMKNAQRNALPIHSYDVAQFKLIGIITGGRGNQAMVTDPGGKGYVLKVGMLIGKNNGKIISINSSGVEIVEKYVGEKGKIQKDNIKLTLPRKQ